MSELQPPPPGRTPSSAGSRPTGYPGLPAGRPGMTSERFWKRVVPGLLLFIIGVMFLTSLFDGLPSLEDLENPRPPIATTVLSADGKVIDRFFEENRARLGAIDSIPPALVQALVATEDQRFFEHWGVDFRAVVRVTLRNLLHFTLHGPGGSTITQQLARNLFLTREVSVMRKFREWLTAIQIERRYTKNEILVMYLNVSSFGRGTYGIETAAETYFAKRPNRLTVSECAFLVGLLKAPSYYDPKRDYERAVRRRNVVLARMRNENYLTDEEFERYRAEPLETQSATRSSGIAPHFAEYVRQLMREKAEKYGFNLYRDGLTVYTSLDSRMQEHANAAVVEHLKTLQPSFQAAWDWNAPRNAAILESALRSAAKTHPSVLSARGANRTRMMDNLLRNPRFVDSVRKMLTRIQVGFTAIDPATGQIKAMVGNSEMQFRYGLNHCTQIQRQPGSTFKPFVYTVAIDNGYTPAYQLSNDPLSIDDGTGKTWSPKNASGEAGGTYTLRKGLALSLNLIVIRTLLQLAPADEVVRYAHKMGITSTLRPYPSLAIGTSEVVPLEIISAYGAFANEGILAQPLAILRIEDGNGRVIENNVPVRKEVLSKETAYIITTMLESAVNGGTGSGTRRWFTGPAAGKTGTTQDYADAWFIGYTPNLVAGVWTGFDDRRITYTGSYGQGAVAAAPIWARFMKSVFADRRIGLPMRSFVAPDGVQFVRLCLDSQGRATEHCPNTVEDYIITRFDPGPCTLHQGSAPSSSPDHPLH